jgi:hypothetical protein
VRTRVQNGGPIFPEPSWSAIAIDTGNPHRSNGMRGRLTAVGLGGSRIRSSRCKLLHLNGQGLLRRLALEWPCTRQVCLVSSVALERELRGDIPLIHHMPHLDWRQDQKRPRIPFAWSQMAPVSGPTRDGVSLAAITSFCNSPTSTEPSRRSRRACRQKGMEIPTTRPGQG